jgi:hypothetical protein
MIGEKLQAGMAECPYCKEGYFIKEDKCLHKAIKENATLKAENGELRGTRTFLQNLLKQKTGAEEWIDEKLIAENSTLKEKLGKAIEGLTYISEGKCMPNSVCMPEDCECAKEKAIETLSELEK